MGGHEAGIDLCLMSAENFMKACKSGGSLQNSDCYVKNYLIHYATNRTINYFSLFMKVYVGSGKIKFFYLVIKTMAAIYGLENILWDFSWSFYYSTFLAVVYYGAA